LKAKYINPFLKASMNLFRDYLAMKITAGNPSINQKPSDLDEVSSIIGLAGETIGAIVLSFPRECAIKIVSIFANQQHSTLSNEVIDGVGELVNIIAGNAKKDLIDFKISISLPGVIIGKSYMIKWPKGIPVICIPFKSEAGDFTVNVSLRDIDPRMISEIKNSDVNSVLRNKKTQ
jgi:chemotaxis protein CheX